AAVETARTLSYHSAGCRTITSIYDGSYLPANEPAWTADFMAKSPREWEHWYIEDWKGGKVVLKGRGGPKKPGQFLRAYSNGHVDLTGKHPKDERLAIWMSYKNSNETWSFQSADGLWLSAHQDGSDARCGTAAQFTLENW
ncbi:hypothetical protein PRIPAC_94625, partial [Pristionchus pacificus]|uniref:Uncharacterized protein n=1 Tax=Pristionchus pacificus TaxID=54126 RepID=A0A2A6BPE8_PRIPA